MDRNEIYELLGAIGSASSILSLALTFFVFIGVRRIRQFYVFNARVPELNDRVSEISSQLSDHLNSFNGLSTKSHEILAEADVTLKALKSKITNQDLRRIINGALNEVAVFRTDSFFRISKPPKKTEEQKKKLETLYVSLYKINAQTTEDLKQSKWER